MAEYIIDGTTLEGLASKVRTLGGISTQLSTNAIIENLQDANSEISKQANLINDIQDRMENGIIEKLIDRTISGAISDNMIDSIGVYAFYNCSSLTSISFPACSSIDRYAFYHCSSLTTVNFPACTSIGYYAFYSCSSLTSVSFPACTSIDSYAFVNCSSLTSVSFPVCTRVASYAFQFCSSLTSVSFPACTSIGSYAFRNCRTLSTVILASTSKCTLAASNAFNSTPYAGYSSYFSGTPYIYVPSSLLTYYKTATNWTYFSIYFSTIESM